MSSTSSPSTLYILFGASSTRPSLSSPNPARPKLLLLLRTPKRFQDNDEFKSLDEQIREKVRIVKGDCTKLDDVKSVFEIAAKWLAGEKDGEGEGTASGGAGRVLGGLYLVSVHFHRLSCSCSHLDLCFPTGGRPTYKFPMTLALDNPHVCYESMMSVLVSLCAYPSLFGSPLVVVSSNGLTRASHNSFSLLQRPIYALIKPALKDKSDMEFLLTHVSKDAIPLSDNYVANPKVDEGIKKAVCERVVIVQAAILTDGAAKGLEKIRESGDGWIVKPGEISRRDTGLFLVDCLLGEKGRERKGKVVISY